MNSYSHDNNNISRYNKIITINVIIIIIIMIIIIIIMIIIIIIIIIEILLKNQDYCNTDIR